MIKFKGYHTKRKPLVCTVCFHDIEIFNNNKDFSLDMHKQEQNHLDAIQSNNNSNNINVQAMINFFNSRTSLKKWGLELEQLADVQFLQKDRNENVQQAVKDVFQKVYKGNLKVIMFGSRISGLTTKDYGDLDLHIDTSDNKIVKPIENSELENWILNKAVNYMKNEQFLIWGNVTAVLACRTPILRAMHLPTQMQCDITVMSRLGVNNTDLMCFYIQNIPVLRQLILVLREWSLHFQFTKTIHNYALSMLVLFYLQTEGYAPSVDELHFECSQLTEDCSGYYCADFLNIKFKHFKVKPTQNLELKDLLLGFFKYYFTFDFHQDAVCPLLGRTIQRKLLERENYKKLPPEMHLYVKKLKNGGEVFKTDAAMCVQDPIDLSHNLTKVTKKMTVNYFIAMCSAAKKALQILN